MKIYLFIRVHRWKTKIPDKLFDVPLDALTSAPRTPFIAILAMILVSIDTIIWLMTLIALAGPALISGIYEAAIDSRVLTYLQEKIRDKKLSVAQRAQLMYTVLVGNLDMLGFPENGDDYDNLWNHINGPRGLLYDLRPRRNKKKAMESLAFTQKILLSLLSGQTDFGNMVGAPVVFFCGTFLYTLFENLASLGDTDIGHSLGRYQKHPQIIWRLFLIA